MIKTTCVLVINTICSFTVVFMLNGASFSVLSTNQLLYAAKVSDPVVPWSLIPHFITTARRYPDL